MLFHFFRVPLGSVGGEGRRKVRSWGCQGPLGWFDGMRMMNHWDYRREFKGKRLFFDFDGGFSPKKERYRLLFSSRVPRCARQVSAGHRWNTSWTRSNESVVARVMMGLTEKAVPRKGP